MIFRKALPLLITALLLVGCSDRFDLGELPLDVELPDVIGDTTFVQIGREWTDFNQPHDIIVGFDQLVYVADTGNNRIVMLDLGGHVQGISGEISNPVAIAQDRRLNLLVAASHDTTVNGQEFSLAAIYKIDLFSAEHRIEEAEIRRIYVETPARQRISFTGVATLHNNQYYVTRRGPNNSSPVNPDNAVLWFNNNDELLPREQWPNLLPQGTGLRAMNQPSAIATFPNRETTDFLLGTVAEDSQFKVQWITFRIIGDSFRWDSYLTPERDAGVDLLDHGKFSRPEGLVIDRDGNMLVADAEEHMIFRFNNRGIERHSFGGPDKFYNPKGVAIDPSRTVYVADTGNNRILRFRLSTDL